MYTGDNIDVPDDVAAAYGFNGTPFYVFLTNSGSSPISNPTLSYIDPNTQVSLSISHASGETIEVPNGDAPVLVKCYKQYGGNFYTKISLGGGGGGGLTTVNFTKANGLNYYDSEYQPQQTIEWARRYEPITLVASTNINPGSDIGTIDDTTIRGRGTMMMYNSNQGFTGIYFYIVENGHVYAQTTIQGNCRVTLF